MKEEVYNSLEQKVSDYIIGGQENELSGKIMFIHQAISRTRPTKVAFPSADDLLSKLEAKPKKNTPRKVLFSKPANIAYALSAAAMLLFVFFLVKFPMNHNKSYATAMSTQGNVHYLSMDDDGLYSDLKEGTKLYKQDLIITEADSSVELQLSSGSTIRVMPNSKLILRKIATNKGGDSEILINGGKVLAYVTKKTDNHTFRVISPTLVTTVKGTKFVVDVVNDSKMKTNVGVLEGKVSVAKIQAGKISNKEILLNAKEQIEESSENGLVKKEISKEFSKELEDFQTEISTNTKKVSENAQTKVQNINQEKTTKQTQPIIQTNRRIEQNTQDSKLDLIKLKDQSSIRGKIRNINEESVEIETPYGIQNIKKEQILFIQND